MLGFIGCFCYRLDYYAYVNKRDENVATKYRYKIVGYKTKAFDEYRQYISQPDKIEKEYEDKMLKLYNSEFSKHFPNVFSENGIPIVLKEISNTTDTKMWPTMIPGALTFSAIPFGGESRNETIIQICIAKSEDIESNITIGCNSKRVVSSIIPPSLLFNDEPAEYVRNAGCSVSYSVKNEMILTEFFSNSPEEVKDACMPCVCALASRLKEIEATGQMDYYYAINEYRRRAMVRQMPINDAKSAAFPVSSKRLYRIQSLCPERDSNFVYTFALELSEGVSISTFFGMSDIFAYEVQAAYQREFPDVDASTLRVEVRHQVSDGMIVGRAEVLTIKPFELNYDASTRKGKLAVRFNANQYEAARKWIRNNIEKLVRDKNIALITGKIPPEAKYYSLDESLKDGNILEIEFKTE